MSAELALIQMVKNQTVRAPTSLVNAANVATFTPVVVTPSSAVGCKAGLSGAMTADTLKTLLTITGPGRLDIAAIASADTTSRTMQMKITLDGVVVFNPGMTAATTTLTAGICAVGAINTAASTMPVSGHVYFNTSCLVEFASSISETDKLNTYLRYQTF